VTHLFEEPARPQDVPYVHRPGTLERVEQLAGDWFARYLRRLR